MYLRYLKTLLVKAVRATFDDDYPMEQLRGLSASIEFPVDQSHYPGIWVDFDDSQPLRTAGVDQFEIAEDGTRYGRWRFAGYASFTIVALSSNERDMIYDEFVSVLAFGRRIEGKSDFRKLIEDNPYIATNMDFDEIEVRGNAAAVGTPWGTDEVVYERTLNMEIIGEFLGDIDTTVMVPLRVIKATVEQELPSSTQSSELTVDVDGASYAPISVGDWT